MSRYVLLREPKLTRLDYLLAYLKLDRFPADNSSIYVCTNTKLPNWVQTKYKYKSSDGTG